MCATADLYAPLDATPSTVSAPPEAALPEVPPGELKMVLVVRTDLKMSSGEGRRRGFVAGQADH